jgi:hypothetical protein
MTRNKTEKPQSTGEISFPCPITTLARNQLKNKTRFRPEIEAAIANPRYQSASRDIFFFY